MAPFLAEGDVDMDDLKFMCALGSGSGSGFGGWLPGFGSGSGFGGWLPGFGSGSGFGACIPVNHVYDHPGEITCDCVHPADRCFEDGLCVHEPLCDEYRNYHGSGSGSGDGGPTPEQKQALVEACGSAEMVDEAVEDENPFVLCQLEIPQCTATLESFGVPCGCPEMFTDNMDEADFMDIVCGNEACRAFCSEQ